MRENIQIVSITMVKEKMLQHEYGSKMSSPNDTVEIFRKFIGNSDREVLALMSLDTKNKINALTVVSIGNLNASIVHPREVFKMAILSNACSIIICHNHPSGDSTPSKEDINISIRLKECGKLLGIELLDHIIIGDEEYTSLKKRGIL
ncbi:JAB domain-containing protein [Clostridium estertheticum]|uniref:JAB domain-containing protein n=1 Tax=Clostridium estertheticum TaxID=238834 RepID=UPI001C7D354E|nr:DNA repair protein RadC [Clostridium estertheticum]MBX4267156.1 DNA repair protein RadC [Clostridium estertheticum]MBX4272021.1 DNA repair protein RadC [Clostridium estertheticum]WLC82406.1 DNA repair protein RadC [Clostridium estertheticum]WLC91279.1 DNA repair protein RadC [Clostridium estertheticum]